jgi:soluble lytic murein transglycosylase-like protein
MAGIAARGGHGARLVLATLALAAAILAARGAAAQPGPQDIGRFPGLARIFREAAAGIPRASAEQDAAGLFDFEQVVLAVAGPGASSTGRSLQDYRDAFAGTRPVLIAVAPGAAARDDTAYRLHSLGYSPKEIADILAGRITKAALDNAQKMLMLGSRAELVSDYLDREYRRLRTSRERAEAGERPPLPTGRPAAAAADAHVVRFASVYGIDAALVRAVIECESGWNQGAVSRVGAIGVMQLMPGTARELGVDPRDLQQNIEGGTRYLAGLLRAFKTVERALIAYNAGPGFAGRYARGQAALYGETREFVKNVLRRMAQ